MIETDTLPQRNYAPKSAVRSAYLGWGLAGLLAVGFALYYWTANRSTTEFPTPYQAVLLSNGAVYYGKLHGYGSSHPVMTEVFYIVSQTNVQTKQVTNVLVKRGGRNSMVRTGCIWSPNQILFVEPVGTGSKVAWRIDQRSNALARSAGSGGRANLGG